jgi:predicted enzyme related to lactoylglutathione lyase
VKANVQPILLTTDLERLQRFYTELFGATEAARVPDVGPTLYVGLHIGDTVLGLVSSKEAEEGTGQRIFLSVDVENVDSLLEDVESAGGTLLAPPRDMPWGQRVAHTRDPDGNAVNLTQST